MKEVVGFRRTALGVIFVCSGHDGYAEGISWRRDHFEKGCGYSDPWI